jgi:hypothetical protein
VVVHTTGVAFDANPSTTWAARACSSSAATSQPSGRSAAFSWRHGSAGGSVTGGWLLPSRGVAAATQIPILSDCSGTEPSSSNDRQDIAQQMDLGDAVRLPKLAPNPRRRTRHTRNPPSHLLPWVDAPSRAEEAFGSHPTRAVGASRLAQPEMPVEQRAGGQEVGHRQRRCARRPNIANAQGAKTLWTGDKNAPTVHSRHRSSRRVDQSNCTRRETTAGLARRSCTATRGCQGSAPRKDTARQVLDGQKEWKMRLRNCSASQQTGSARFKWPSAGAPVLQPDGYPIGTAQPDPGRSRKAGYVYEAIGTRSATRTCLGRARGRSSRC